MTWGSNKLESKFLSGSVVLRFYSPLSVVGVGFHGRQRAGVESTGRGLRPNHRAGPARSRQGGALSPGVCPGQAKVSASACPLHPPPCTCTGLHIPAFSHLAHADFRIFSTPCSGQTGPTRPAAPKRKAEMIPKPLKE